MVGQLLGVECRAAQSDPLQQVLARADTMLCTQEGLHQLAGPGSCLYQALLQEGRKEQQQQQQQPQEGVRSGLLATIMGPVSTRQLLWEVLGALKPSACQWYEAAAAQHMQQQHESGNFGAVGSAEASAASVPACPSAALWTTLTRSLASNLLLVPPSLRDMLGNDWAAGAGRLGAVGDAGGNSNTSGSSGSSGDGSAAATAARMLVVQYAQVSPAGL
jgi:hypothetical protein